MLMEDLHKLLLERHLLLPALTSRGAWAHPGRCRRASSRSSCQHCGSCALPGKRHTELGHNSPEPPRASLGPQPGAPELPECQPESGIAAKPRGQEPATYRHRTQPRISPSGLVRSSSRLWAQQTGQGGTGHQQLDTRCLFPASRRASSSYIALTPQIHPALLQGGAPQSPVTAGTPESITSLEKSAGTKAGLMSPPW